MTHHRLVLERTRRFERSCRPVQQDGEPRTRFMIKFGERGGRDKEFSRHRDLACVLMPSSRQASGVFQDSRGISVTPKVLSRGEMTHCSLRWGLRMFFSASSRTCCRWRAPQWQVRRPSPPAAAASSVSVMRGARVDRSRYAQRRRDRPIGASEGRVRGGEVSPPTSHCI